MAAAFVAYDKSADVFKFKGSNNTSLVYAFGLEAVLLESSNDAVLIVTDANFSNPEIMQFFPTFGDSINFTHFGSGLGTCQLSGMAFANCEESLEGSFKLLQTYYSEYRGVSEFIDILGFGMLRAVLTQFNTSILAEPVRAANFTFTYNVVQII